MHGAPPLLELGLGHVVETPGLGLEPLVDLGLRGNVLVDFPRLVLQVENDATAPPLVKLVGVNVSAKDLYAFLLVRLEEGCPSEADEHGVREDGLHRLVQIT